MKRRDLLAAGGATALAWTAAAQPAMKRVGYLGSTSAAEQSAVFAAFRQRLAELGWVEGHSVLIEQRWADGREAPLAPLAMELAALRMDAIVTGGAAAIAALMRATTTIPIVFSIANDPVGTGLIASLARPGGNVTGLSYQGPDLAGKRIEIMREALPQARRLAVLANGEAPGARLEMLEAVKVARGVGLEATPVEVSRDDLVEGAMTRAAGAGDAVYVCADPLVTNNRRTIVEQALRLRLATVFGDRADAIAGGLMSYGPSRLELSRRAAEFVDRILRGARPGDLPVEQPSRFEFVINATTARTLGLTMPPALLARADSVVE
jgi:putative tryptophan/tyrosine transport system substrate-binding protein